MIVIVNSIELYVLVISIDFCSFLVELFSQYLKCLFLLCNRRRTLVAIGTHDLDTLQAPFTYEVGYFNIYSLAVYLTFLCSLSYFGHLVQNSSLQKGKQFSLSPDSLWNFVSCSRTSSSSALCSTWSNFFPCHIFGWWGSCGFFCID